MEQKSIRKILLLEDDESVREALMATLEFAGVEVTAVTTLRAALDAKNENSFDAVISDFNLEDGDGMELYKAFRDAGNSLLFIMISGREANRDNEAVRKAIKDDENFAFYPKPFRDTDILGRLGLKLN